MALISFFYITKISFRGVAGPDLILGLALVGVSSITSASAGVRAAILRLLSRQSRATLARGLTAILTLSAFAVAYHWYGVDASLIFGFITLAITSPVVFICLAGRFFESLQGSSSVISKHEQEAHWSLARC